MEVRRDPRGNILGATPLAGMPTFSPGERQSLEQQAEANTQAVVNNRQGMMIARFAGPGTLPADEASSGRWSIADPAAGEIIVLAQEGCGCGGTSVIPKEASTP